MVHKETCPECKGNRYIRIIRDAGEPQHRRCPACDGNGYRIRISLDTCRGD